jgi:hypothetical protein
MPSIAVSFMEKKIILCALQQSTNFHTHTYRLLEINVQLLETPNISDTNSPETKNRWNRVDINIKIKYILLYFIYQSVSIMNNFLNFALHPVTIFLA